VAGKERLTRIFLAESLLWTHVVAQKQAISFCLVYYHVSFWSLSVQKFSVDTKW